GHRLDQEDHEHTLRPRIRVHRADVRDRVRQLWRDLEVIRLMHPLILILIFASRAVYAEDYRSSPVTPANSFTDGIEGPACDQQGNLYAVSYEREGTVGRRPEW